MPSSELMRELRIIREELQYIREHMVDVDMLLTPEEKEMVFESLQEFSAGKTVRLDDLERDAN